MKAFRQGKRPIRAIQRVRNRVLQQHSARPSLWLGYRAQCAASNLFYSIGTVWVERTYFVLGSSAEDAPPRTRLPSSKATLLALTKLEPSLAREPLTWTTSPTFKEFRVQPCRIKPFGLPSSNSQLVTLRSEERRVGKG